MKITVCIGSSCHLKGSRQVIEKLKELIEENGISEKIELSGNFCMSDCQNGVCIRVDEEKFSVTENEVDFFFTNNVLKKLK